MRNTVEFVTFIKKFLKVYSVDDVSNMGEELKVLLKSKFPGQMLVLLIDELSKLDKVPSQSEVYPVSECVRSYFCSLMDGADPMVSRSVFSSLTILKLGSQKLFTNESERPIKIVGRLDMLSQKECTEIILDTFNEHGIGVLMSNDQKVPESQKAKRFDDSIYRIYILSGGHPRTLDTLLRAILDYRAFNIARGRNPTMSDLLAFIGSNDFIEKESLSESNFECVRSVLPHRRSSAL